MLNRTALLPAERWYIYIYIYVCMYMYMYIQTWYPPPHHLHEYMYVYIRIYAHVKIGRPSTLENSLDALFVDFIRPSPCRFFF